MTDAAGPTFLLGLPALRDGALWREAVRLAAPILVSANALSLWRKGRLGLREWAGFDRRNLHLVERHPVSLDSAGFVSARAYRGFLWSVDDYMDLAAAAPWRTFFAMDWCVEKEVAADREAVKDRISATVRMNVLCRNGAERRGILHRFAPVLQGWAPIDYARCLERMPFALDFPVVGIGSMCRRHVGGADGLLRVIEALDRAFEGSNATYHLFGLKSQGMAAVRGHPRVRSVDSQAYGTGCRQQAWRAGVAKTDALLASYMAAWYRKQVRQLAAPGYSPPAMVPLPPNPERELHPVEARIAAAAERLRSLHEAGEIDWQQVSRQAALEMAFMDDEESFDEITGADCGV